VILALSLNKFQAIYIEFFMIFLSYWKSKVCSQNQAFVDFKINAFVNKI